MTLAHLDTDLLVVTGPMRSGTTLLADCLQSADGTHRHPDLAFSDDNFVDIRKLSEILRRSSGASIAQMDPTRDIPVQMGAVDSFYGRPFASEFRKRILEASKRDQSTRMVGFKNTALLGEFRVLKTFFPQAKMVVMVRDPRDIYISYVTRARKNPYPEQAERHHPEAVMNSMFLNAYADYQACEDIMFLRYEDLVIDPSRELRRVLGFAGLAENDFNWKSLVKDVINNSSFDIVNPDDIIRESGIHRRGIGRHEDLLSGFHLYTIETLSAKAMDKFGYVRRTRWRPMWEVKLAAEFLPRLVASFELTDFYCPPSLVRRARRFARLQKYTERYIAPLRGSV